MIKNNKLGNFLYIESPKNSVIKTIVKLTKKNKRNKYDLFIAEGEYFLFDALKNNWEIELVIINKNSFFTNNINNLLESCVKNKIKIFETNDIVLKKISKNRNFQNLLFLVKPKYNYIKNQSQIKLTVALENIRDPKNLGTILRTIDAFGISNCFLIGNSVDQYAIDSVRSSMGSIFKVKIIKCTQCEFFNWIKANNVNIYSTYIKSNNSYIKTIWEFPMCVLFGNEQKGISKKFVQTSKNLLKIPLKKNDYSLNISIACGVIISDIIRKNPNLMKEL